MFSTTNLYSNVTEFRAGRSRIGGISNDPFDWGSGISFTSFGGLSDPTAHRELDQTYSFSETVSWNRENITGVRRRLSAYSPEFSLLEKCGGEFCFYRVCGRPNTPPGVTNHSGYGLRFRGFLLGFPQQTSLQSGATSYNFRANAFDFLAGRWRFARICRQLGLRYEYNGPYAEAEIALVIWTWRLDSLPRMPVLPGKRGLTMECFRPPRPPGSQ